MREEGDGQKRVAVDHLAEAIMNSMLDWNNEAEEEEKA